MRTIDPILAAAMPLGGGQPITRISIGGNTYDLISYRWSNMQFSCSILGAVVGDYQNILIATRGLKIGTTEYLVSIGSFFIETLNISALTGITSITAHALPAGAVTNIDGDDDALTVLGRVGTEYSFAFKAIPAAQDWLDIWQFFKDTSLLNLVSAKLIESLMWQKRRAHCYQRYDGVYLTNPSSDSAGYSSIYNFTLPEDTLLTNLRLENYVCYWKDENNFSYSSYGDGVPPGSAPRCNLGYIDSSVTPANVGALGLDGGGQFQFTQLPDLALEQGEPASSDIFGAVSVLKFLETFNSPEGSGWKQVVTDQHWQPFLGYGDDPIVVNDFTTIIQNITNAIYSNTQANLITLDSSTFNNILSTAIVNVQSALEKLDDHSHGNVSWYLYENFY